MLAGYKWNSPEDYNSFRGLIPWRWQNALYANRRGFVNITDTVAELVRKSGVSEGPCLVNAMHITESLFINYA